MVPCTHIIVVEWLDAMHRHIPRHKHMQMKLSSTSYLSMFGVIFACLSSDGADM